MEKLKINYMTQNKTWTNPQIKKPWQEHWTQTDQTTDTTQNPEQMCQTS